MVGLPHAGLEKATECSVGQRPTGAGMQLLMPGSFAAAELDRSDNLHQQPCSHAENYSSRPFSSPPSKTGAPAVTMLKAATQQVLALGDLFPRSGHPWRLFREVSMAILTNHGPIGNSSQTERTIFLSLAQ